MPACYSEVLTALPNAVPAFSLRRLRVQGAFKKAAGLFALAQKGKFMAGVF